MLHLPVGETLHVFLGAGSQYLLVLSFHLQSKPNIEDQTPFLVQFLQLASMYCFNKVIHTLKQGRRAERIYQITEKMDKFKFSHHGIGITVITEQTSEY